MPLTSYERWLGIRRRKRSGALYKILYWRGNLSPWGSYQMRESLSLLRESPTGTRCGWPVWAGAPLCFIMPSTTGRRWSQVSMMFSWLFSHYCIYLQWELSSVCKIQSQSTRSLPWRGTFSKEVACWCQSRAVFYDKLAMIAESIWVLLFHLVLN